MGDRTYRRGILEYNNNFLKKSYHFGLLSASHAANRPKCEAYSHPRAATSHKLKSSLVGNSFSMSNSGIYVRSKGFANINGKIDSHNGFKCSFGNPLPMQILNREK